MRLLVAKQIHVVAHHGLQNQYRINYDRQVAKNISWYADRFPDWSKDQVERYAKRASRRFKASSRAYAHAMPKQKNETWKDLNGIAINQKHGANAKTLLASLERDTKTQFHPIGTDRVRSIVDHELGHSLDYLLNIRRKPEIESAFKEFMKTGSKADLSEYARKNIAEFIAEGWSEYLNNPKPRKYAKFIGEFIEQEYATRYGR